MRKNKTVFFLFMVLIALPIPASYDVYMKYKKYERNQILKTMQKEKGCIITALYHEASGEGEMGMRYVAGVIENRLYSSGFPDSYCGVINQPSQFSYTKKKYRKAAQLKIYTSRKKDKSTDMYEAAEDIADEMILGEFKNPLNQNVLWYTNKHVKNYWTIGKKVVKEFGNHRFYSN